MIDTYPNDGFSRLIHFKLEDQNRIFLTPLFAETRTPVFGAIKRHDVKTKKAEREKRERENN